MRQLGVAVSEYSRSHVAGDLEAAHWDPDRGEIDLAPLAQSEAVVNLAGESLVGGRWTEERRRRFRASRVASTRVLCEAIARTDPLPRVLVNASAVGFYGDRGESAVTEDSPVGDGFLAQLCQEWEQATAPAVEAGVRVVYARFGIVLSTDGGALAAMLPAFRLGLGGPLGNGQQFMPWVTLRDAVRAVRFCITDESVTGPVNIVAPEATRNRKFTRALGAALRRPARLRVPGFALKAVLGPKAAQELLLTGANVRPSVLERAGFRFDAPRLDDALAMVLEDASPP